MKISLNWIKDYVDGKFKADTLAHRLTMAGLEVEEISHVGKDTVFELEITPNRADCLSMLGMAREIATIFESKLTVPSIPKSKAVKATVPVKIEDKKDCRIYTGQLIEGVAVKESPKEIQQRLQSIGIRPISNLVDVTNFCMMEMGQPLHVFDADKLAGGSIVVRRARKGEKIVTIDDVERELDEGVLVIADAEKPVAIAGIMGGKDTEVTSATRNVLLESAYFDPILIRRTSRKLGLSSDSCYRFERGVDIAGVNRVGQRALDMILNLAGGKVVARGQAGTDQVKAVKPVKISLDRINSYLGTSLNATQVKGTLKKLNFSIVSPKAGHFEVTAPSSRSDIHSDVDLIEEVARIIGYDNLPESLPNIQVVNIPENSDRQRRQQLREMMLSQGFSEAITFSLLNRKELAQAKVESKDVLAISNPLSLDQEILRSSMLPSLLQVVRANVNRGQRHLRLFELGKIYQSTGREAYTLGIVCTGNLVDDWRELKKRNIGYYDIKGAIVQAFERASLGGLEFEASQFPYFEEGNSVAMMQGGKPSGMIGRVQDGVLKNFGIKIKDVWFAQVRVPAVGKPIPVVKFKELSEYPAITRDISLALDQNIQYKDVLAAARSNGGEFLQDVVFCEEYLGEKIPAGQRGIIISLKYQSNDRTLTEQEVNDAHQQVLDQIVSSFQATIR